MARRLLCACNDTGLSMINAERSLKVKPVYVKNWPAFFIAIIVIGHLSGCGKKGPPVPPPRYLPPAVTDLVHRVDGRNLTLSWTIPDPAGQKKAATDGCVVYRARQSVSESQCTGCPVPYVSVAEIPVGQRPNGSGQTRVLTYTETLLPDFTYTYKVVCFTRVGGPGDDSNVVNFSF